jgi:hypothetical protein
LNLRVDGKPHLIPPLAKSRGGDRRGSPKAINISKSSTTQIPVFTGRTILGQTFLNQRLYPLLKSLRCLKEKRPADQGNQISVGVKRH